MADTNIDELLKLAQTVDLYGRNEQYQRLLNEGNFGEALAICDTALIDSEEMTRPDRTSFRRNVHQQNQIRVQLLRDKTAELAGQ